MKRKILTLLIIFDILDKICPSQDGHKHISFVLGRKSN